MISVRYDSGMLSALRKILQEMFNDLLDYIFPITCIVCGKIGSDICTTCEQRFLWPKKKRFPWVYSLWNYRDPAAEKIIRYLKHYPNPRLVTIIGKKFSEIISNRPTESENWIIIPIPIAKDRFRDRGFNQSEVIATGFSQAFCIPIGRTILVKAKRTQKQGTMRSSAERRMNMTDAFMVTDPRMIQKKNVIIIDDVTTTGSTLSEARDTLLHHGARKVLAVTVAN